jgi:hypothetical protein
LEGDQKLNYEWEEEITTMFMFEEGFKRSNQSQNVDFRVQTRELYRE